MVPVLHTTITTGLLQFEREDAEEGETGGLDGVQPRGPGFLRLLNASGAERSKFRRRRRTSHPQGVITFSNTSRDVFKSSVSIIFFGRYAWLMIEGEASLVQQLLTICTVCLASLLQGCQVFFSLCLEHLSTKVLGFLQQDGML